MADEIHKGDVREDVKMSSTEAPQWVRVGDASVMSARTELRLRNRRITVIRLPDGGHGHDKSTKFVALDTVCYHAGGPLGSHGRILSFDGRHCLQCPWHGYLIDMHSGEGLYRDTDGRLTSKGRRQRVHEVEHREDGSVWVRLGRVDGGSPLASDQYAFGPKHPLIRSDYYDVPALDW